MQARLRRLASEHDQIRDAFASHPVVSLVGAEGSPPDRYVFHLNVPGLAPAGEDGFAPANDHRVEIFLPLDYPRRPPIARMLTPVFHPNIDPQKICIGDHWSAGQSVAQMIQRIAEMISYQSYNIQSPLNAKAAAWAAGNLHNLPLSRGDLGG